MSIKTVELGEFQIRYDWTGVAFFFPGWTLQFNWNYGFIFRRDPPTPRGEDE